MSDKPKPDDRPASAQDVARESGDVAGNAAAHDGAAHHAERRLVAHVSLRDLFFGFLGLGLMAFGGAMPLARRTIVEQRRWLTPEEFTELLGLCQFLPGGNVINLSVAIGMRFRGVAGSLAAILGLIGGPTAIVIVLGVIYERTQGDPRVQHLFAGLAAAAAGLLVAMAVKLALPLRGKPAAIGIAVLGLVAIAGLRVPLPLAMLVLTPLSIVIAVRSAR